MHTCWESGLAFALALLAACFQPTFTEGAPCGEGDLCPSGQTCYFPEMQCFSSPPAIRPDAGLPLCSAPDTDCGGTCVDLANNSAHCGACNKPCLNGELCGNSVCAATCPDGLTECDGVCVDLTANDENCGGCGVDDAEYICADTDECQGGACQPRCETFLVEPVQDPWGTYWDSEVRQLAGTWQTAADVCAGLGGGGARLPTVSELYRVSAPRGGFVGAAGDSQDLWSLAPSSAVQHMAVRLDNAAITNQTDSDPEFYRCVCPPKLDSFRSSACFGDPGSECHPLEHDAGRFAIDRRDRPGLARGPAIFECQFAGGTLADTQSLVAGIAGGLDNGSNQYLRTADDVRRRNSLLVRWSGVGAGWDLNGNVTYDASNGTRPFRCVGPSFAGGVYQGTIVDEFAGLRRKSEANDSVAAVSWVEPYDTCWSRGGHLPVAGELADLIQQGLPNGSNQYLWSAEENGKRDGKWWLSVLRWSDASPWFNYIPQGNYDWLSKNNDSARFRCVYYPVDPSYVGPTAEQCQGGCFEVVLPTSGNKMWFDSEDRAAATPLAAHNGCRTAGGRLASARDLVEGIRLGALPNGSGTAIQASSFVRAGDDPIESQLEAWTGTDPAYTFLDSDGLRMDQTAPYRCMWTDEVR